jgi:hypothetical protein
VDAPPHASRDGVAVAAVDHLDADNTDAAAAPPCSVWYQVRVTVSAGRARDKMPVLFSWPATGIGFF